MNFIDILIIVLFIYGFYLGYQSGFLSIIKNTIVLFIASLLSSFLSDLLFGLLYKSFPFFNFIGKAQGLKSINIIFWKVILFILVLLLILFIIRGIFNRLDIDNKILDSEMTSGIISRIFGVIFSTVLVVIVVFDITLVLLSPNFNFKSLNNSLIAKTIMKNTPVLSEYNKKLYENEKYIIKRINKSDNNKTSFSDVNEELINNMLETEFVSSKIIDYYEGKNMLLGTKATKKKKKIETTTTTENDDEEFEDEEYNENDEEFEDEEFSDEEFEDEEFEDEEIYDEEFSDEEIYDDEFSDEGFE